MHVNRTYHMPVAALGGHGHAKRCAKINGVWLSKTLLAPRRPDGIMGFRTYINALGGVGGNAAMDALGFCDVQCSKPAGYVCHLLRGHTNTDFCDNIVINVPC